MTKKKAFKTVYSSPGLEVLDERIENCLCEASENVGTDKFDDLTDYQW